jgi:cytochrome c peroxidase
VLKPRGDPRLALEPPRDVAILGQQLLDRDLPAKAQISRLDHATHPAPRELANHDVMTALDFEQLGVVANDRENLDRKRVCRLLPLLDAVDRRFGIARFHAAVSVCSPHAAGHDGIAAAKPASMLGWQRWAMWRCLCALVVVVAGCWSDDPQVNGLTSEQWEHFKNDFALHDAGTGSCSDVERGLDCDGVERLGQELFWEPAMSTRIGSDGMTLVPGSVRCITCHDPTMWFIDSRTPNNVSQGATKLTARNAMTVVNMALKYDEKPAHGLGFSWIGFPYANAGAVTDLAVRKAMSSTPNVVFNVIMANPWYAMEIGSLWQNQNPSFNDLEIALDAYMRRLVSLDAPFDRWIAGDETAINDSAKRGFVVFVGRGNCVECHHGPAFTDYEVHDTGVPHAGSDDFGLGSDNADFMGAFATQSLRNIARTGPYMHDGSLPSLDAVVDFYRNGGGASSYLGVKDPRITPLDLTDEDAHDLVEFLKTLNGADVPAQYTKDIRPTITCMPTTTLCNGMCLSVESDPNNCGGCGITCQTGTSCVMGMCVPSACQPGLTECAVGGCVNLQVDFNHCGACANMCDATQACVMGTCVTAPMCPQPLAPCGSMCKDLENDPMNCGGCGHVCATYCMSGVCG